MPRIMGVDLPADKPTHISLRYLFGIGPTLALKLCEQARRRPPAESPRADRRRNQQTDDVSRSRVRRRRPAPADAPAEYCAGCGTSIATAVSAIARVCRSADNDPKPTLARGRAPKDSRRQEGRQGNAHLAACGLAAFFGNTRR